VPGLEHEAKQLRSESANALPACEDQNPLRLENRQLQEGEKSLRLKSLVFDRSIAANSITDANGVITEVNDTFVRIWGYSSRGEAVGRSIPDFFEDIHTARSIIRQLEDTGIWEGEYSAKRKDGSTFLAYGLATSLVNEEGQIIGFQSSSLDLSHHDRAALAVVESETHFRLLCENSLSGIYIVENGRFNYVNPTLAEISGYSRDELIGMEVMTFVHPDDRTLVRENLRRSMAGQAASMRYEFRAFRKNGEVIQVLVLGVAAELEAGRRVLIGNLLDVSARRQAEQEAAMQVQFERLLAELLSRIATAPLKQLDETISNAQSLMCDFLAADLSSIYRPCGDDTRALQLTYLYLRPGITLPPVPDELRSDAYFPWCQEELLSGRILFVSSTRDLPEDAVRDRLSWQYFGIKTSLMFPLIAVNNEVIGTLSFDTITQQRFWSDETVSRLKLLAQTIAYALERKRSEAERHDGEEQFRAAFEQAGIGVARVAANGAWLEVNRKLCEILGYGPNELRQTTFEDVTHPEDRGNDRDRFRRALAGEIQTYGLDKRFIRKNGDIRWVFQTVACVRHPDHSLRHFVWVVDDITDDKRVAEERRRISETLTQCDRLASMGMLAAGVAHEINSSLASILYSLESLSEELPRFAKQLAGAQQSLTQRLGDELRGILGANLGALNSSLWFDAADRLKEAVKETQKIREIARRLGTFSKVDSDPFTPVDLRFPIISALSLASNEIKYRAQLLTDIGSTAPVLGSEGRLAQVFVNLLANAAQAIKEGDAEHNMIRLRTWQEGPTVLAEVLDTGCGIAESDLGRIFDPLATSRAQSGSRLGLSVVRTIITEHDGSIEVKSEVGEGTRFLIRLPAYSGEHVEESNRLNETDDAVPARGRVLIVDDDPGILRALRRILKDHDVVTAESGEQALDILAKDQDFQVMLCDVMMRPTSGMDVHRWLLENYPVLAGRVVFLTAGAFTPRARSYLEKVENLWLEKPFDTTNLLNLVTERVLAAGTKQ
jgi:PAS domain S-box-containing protein